MKLPNSLTKPASLPVLITILVLSYLLPGCGEDSGGDDPTPAAPTITTINPTSGIIGTEVTIIGSNFSSTTGENTVTFNGITATVTSASSTQLVVEVPENATTGAVAVVVNDQRVEGPTFTVIPANLYDCNNDEITENTTWEDVEPGDAVDYVIHCAISVKGNALLTIEPGVTIAFEGEESGIFTSEGGGLKAVGTASSPIKFIGSSENKGTWKGVYFASNHPENWLEYVTVQHAGRTASSQSDEKGAVQLTRKEDSKAAIVNCTIDDNDGYGIFITEESVLSEFANNVITNNTAAPIGLYFNQLGALDAASDYQGNGETYVEVRENAIDAEAMTLAMLNVPYRFVESSKYDINQALTISPGSILEFGNGAGFRLGDQSSDCVTTTGSLNASGTEENPIIFRGIAEGKGSWLGIGFNSSSPNNRLIYCEVSGGGSSKLYNAAKFAANISLQCESKLTMQHTTISESGGYGIYLLDEDATLDTFEENALINNELAPIYLQLPQVAYLDAASAYAEGNGRAYIEVAGGNVEEEDLTIAKLEVPYRMAVDPSGRPTYIEKVLTIMPGVTLEFENAAGIILGSPSVDCIATAGGFHAVGTAEEPIVLKGTTEGQGSWLGIGINSSTADNQLIYCNISGGGSKKMYNAGGKGNIVIHCKGKAEVKNCSITNSGSWGIDFVQGGNTLIDENNSFDNNADGEVAPN
ncbi:MAG: IPT/TIG domain-containing protein [Cyclobacteriaceae bacterium]|jgi:hypothetical protein